MRIGGNKAMKFILQSIYEDDKYDIDRAVMLNMLLDRQRRGLDRVEIMSMQNLDYFDTLGNDIIPIGSLEFTREYLRKSDNIQNLNPIEIPEILRNSHFIKREYQIIYGKDIPKTGRYFIKSAQTLKDFTYLGNLESIAESYDIKINPDELYVVSSIIENVQAEYRVFVHRGKILGVKQYDGDPLTEITRQSIERLKQIVGVLSIDSQMPKSYTIDIMAYKNEQTGQMDFEIIEVHPMVSVGLYGFDSDKLLEMHADGIKYYREINKAPAECKINIKNKEGYLNGHK